LANRILAPLHCVPDCVPRAVFFQPKIAEVPAAQPQL
jgi:hypothetical protein